LQLGQPRRGNAFRLGIAKLRLNGREPFPQHSKLFLNALCVIRRRTGRGKFVTQMCELLLKPGLCLGLRLQFFDRLMRF
jgi:hypothetical protein